MRNLKSAWTNADSLNLRLTKAGNRSPDSSEESSEFDSNEVPLLNYYEREILIFLNIKSRHPSYQQKRPVTADRPSLFE